MITTEHIKSLLELQKATNVAYFGEEWKNVWSQNAIINSIYREWAEFLDETTRDWKVYGNDIGFHHANAVYELVDVVHFMLCFILVDRTKGEIEEEMENLGRRLVPGTSSVGHRNVTYRLGQFMNDPCVETLMVFLSTVCSYMEIDIETYMLAHKRKNDRNRLRAAGGANYDKSAETPLTLEF
ncbi:nucleoside triphosphate pyrophosphohydrolase [Salmonella phage SeF3a]|uniref:Putative dUTP diphosphatase n=1 Tax=Salmonella phage barely TaxID=2713278 RepID=A0A6G8RNY3_9CAUD|nr:nucleoside triphosphate pyrophosphohydrolase [Salmonella phage barely]QFR58375.1 dUTP diphosphatase [Escherichia phage vB_EcoM_3HA11]QIO03128.1 putative dUTP diphosphatase [Salmonella phage barely]WDS51196.1 nucleoside triphosphate pyrophosphohydrolase [Salmonella phage SeF3a]